MNKKNRKLEQKRLFLNKRIREIKIRQNDLMLKNILLNSQREELEFKRRIVERLIVPLNNQPRIPKQIIKKQINNVALPSALFMN